MQLHKIDAVNRKAVSTTFGASSKWIAVLRLAGGKGSPHHHFSSRPGWVPDILGRENTGNNGSGIHWKLRHDAALRALKHWSDRVSSATFDSDCVNVCWANRVRKEKELNLGKKLAPTSSLMAYTHFLKPFTLLKLRGHAWRARKEVFFFLSSDDVLTKV